MKIAILGAGALGSVLGAFMRQAGMDVCFLDTNRAHIDAINASGLRFDGPGGTEHLDIPAMRPAECGADIGLVILLTKAFHSTVALESIKPLIDNKIPVLSIQNGLGNAERVAETVPQDQVFFGSTMTPGDFIGPGHVASHGREWTVFKSLTPSAEKTAREIADHLAPIDFEYNPDADVKIWQKAAFNCALNATCAVTGQRVGAISNSDEAMQFVKKIADEVIDVANARGIAADKKAVHAQIDEALALHQNHKPSMLQDVEAGRKTEIESLCGEVDRQASALGIAVPLNTSLATLIRLKSS